MSISEQADFWPRARDNDGEEEEGKVTRKKSGKKLRNVIRNGTLPQLFFAKKIVKYNLKCHREKP